MTLTGSYGSVRDFIHRLEQSKDFLVIDRVVLKENNADDSQLSLQVDLSTYFKEQAE
jgi:Tfp pilus assembly protein PilN